MAKAGRQSASERQQGGTSHQPLGTCQSYTVRVAVPLSAGTQESHCRHQSALSPDTESWWPSGKESVCSAQDVNSIPGQEDPLEKGMATHSGVLAWEIPRTEEPGRLQSMGLQELPMTERLNTTPSPGTG